MPVEVGMKLCVMLLSVMFFQVDAIQGVCSLFMEQAGYVKIKSEKDLTNEKVKVIKKINKDMFR